MLHQVPGIDAGRLESFLRTVPLGRVAAAEEVARLALFLASDESSYCTGAEFIIDGGISA
jgi:3alpha(or 20beta)-hydroxysteroid dehydrogenase